MDKILYKNASVYLYGSGIKSHLDVLVEDGTITKIDNEISEDGITRILDLSKNDKNYYILPGFTDMHVHFREPGFTYKETIKTGSMAALNGGYSHVCTMPNLKPVPDSLDNLQIELDAIEKDAVVNVIPYGSITKDEKGEIVSDMEDMVPYVIGFSDDGCGVASDEIMYEAMERAAKLGKPVAGHCEVKTITGNGVINDGVYARINGIPGIVNASEFVEVERNIEIARRTGCHFHVCHASTKETIDLVRKAKKEGINVTCETGPQYLLLDETMMYDDGRFRFQPPLRRLRDRLALIQGIQDGTIDIIATDHAPHSLEEKSKGIAGSLNGVVGLEAAFPMLFTYLVKEGVISFDRLMDLMVNNPKKIFGVGSQIRVGAPAEFSIWDLQKTTTINPEEFESMGRCTPFAGYDVYGVRKLTMMRDKVYGKR